MNNNENSNIIDQNKRKDTLIVMMRRKGPYFEDCTRLQISKDDQNQNKAIKINNISEEVYNTNEKNIDFLNHKRKREKISYDPEIEPKIKIVEYIYSHQKSNLNRNTILRIPVQTRNQGFENLLTLCNKFFTKNNTNKIISETLSFLEELTLENDDFQQNKAIIIVPSIFYPGNICLENAKKFLLDAQ